MNLYMVVNWDTINSPEMVGLNCDRQFSIFSSHRGLAFVYRRRVRDNNPNYNTKEDYETVPHFLYKHINTANLNVSDSLRCFTSIELIKHKV